MLIVLGGLPGTGKTTLARHIVEAFRACYVRIDTIEQTLRDTGLVDGEMGPAGYVLGYRLASENLRLGQTVVADSVNSIAITRDAWRRTGEQHDAVVIEVEVICSDPTEHRRRVESRAGDIPGLTPPTWDAVIAREYEPWDRDHIVIDTAGRTERDCVRETIGQIARAGGVAVEPFGQQTG
ncbi:Chloramphenicol phosphotransferase-like protein [Maioricimonas rarisocia]|uniref:Chloramphenicol phosphotransferase-like protein n=1 Tax=Maioricimonas rarisocia TaxID=2528026 RepID=A0A517ZET3_9PLAN|nr:AAA family ATPase [Maioricimonas rarisocia]QDU40964.1 Chloramphenicol phosphotransferase-like protein [Maioricimonas rarisocia]